MSIIATNEGGSSFEPIAAGTYAARCYSMIHIGTIKDNYQGQEKIMNKVRISWELPTETKVFKEENGEQPHVISKEFTLSMHEKSNLRKILDSWRGKAFTDEEASSFDITDLLGVPCMLSVIHRTSAAKKTYAEISAVTTLPKGMECPEQVNKSFEFNYDNFDQVEFNNLPDWLKDKMKGSQEYKSIDHPEDSDLSNETENFEPHGDDDLPF